MIDTKYRIPKLTFGCAQDEQKEEIARAKSHFTLVALAPETVEMLELKVVPNRRTVWTRRDEAGEIKWDVQAVVP